MDAVEYRRSIIEGKRTLESIRNNLIDGVKVLEDKSVYCSYCNYRTQYSKRGNMTQHMKTFKHIGNFIRSINTASK